MKKNKKKWIVIVLVILLIILSILIGTNLYINSLLSKVEIDEKIDTEDAYIIEKKDEVQNNLDVIENIALFGADNSQKESQKFDEDRSDAMKIISLNKTDKTIAITSVERDVVVYIPGEYQQYGHFNWAYWFGGAKLAVQTLNYNLDLDITKYVTFSFGALEKLIDLVGGVDLYLTDAEINQTNKPLGVSGPAGVYTLNGSSALMYCRIRYIDSDFNRMDRQNNVIKAVMNKLKDQDIFSILNIVNEILPYIHTNLTVDEIKDYLTSVLTYDLSDIKQYKEPSGEYNDIQICPGLGGYIVRSYSDMVEELHKNIYGIASYEVSDRVKETEADIYNTYGAFSKE